MREELPASSGTYRLFGLNVRSDVPLLDLDRASADGPPDVAIVRADQAGPFGAQGLSSSGSDMVLTVTGVARYTIGGGRRIKVEAAPGADWRNLRLYLLGSAFGALLHQRGMLPLHANAIDLNGRAIAFLGHSGAGKSTMAAWFHDRGYRILADDVCVVRADREGLAVAHAGLPRLRLWKDALEKGGRSSADYQRSFDGLEKFDVPTHKRDGPDHMPLAAIYRLGRSEACATEAQIRRLTGVEAVDALVGNTYRGSFVRHLGGTGRHLMDCVALAKAVPVFTADRFWGYERFDAEAERLEAHALAEFGAATVA